MTKLYAQPYNIEAKGFFFESAQEFRKRSANLKDRFGQPVEEFEVQFIDGDDKIDADFARAFHLHQGNLERFFECVEDWEEPYKIRFIIAVGECGYHFGADKFELEDLEIDIYELNTMRELAELFVDDGLFGEVPKSFENYIDYDAIARDLAIDYAETDIAGQHIIYRYG